MPRKLTGPVVIATHNPGKLGELRDLLRTCGDRARQLPASSGLGEPEETGDTFVANALIKAAGGG